MNIEVVIVYVLALILNIAGLCVFLVCFLKLFYAALIHNHLIAFIENKSSWSVCNGNKLLLLIIISFKQFSLKWDVKMKSCVLFSKINQVLLTSIHIITGKSSFLNLNSTTFTF